MSTFPFHGPHKKGHQVHRERCRDVAATAAESCGVKVAINNDDHAPSSANKLEETVTYECHSGHTLDGKICGSKSFTTTCVVAVNESVALSPTPGSSALTTCQTVTCGIPPLASFSTESIKSEVFCQDVVKYSCEEGFFREALREQWGSGVSYVRC